MYEYLTKLCICFIIIITYDEHLASSTFMLLTDLLRLDKSRSFSFARASQLAGPQNPPLSLVFHFRLILSAIETPPSHFFLPLQASGYLPQVPLKCIRTLQSAEINNWSNYYYFRQGKLCVNKWVGGSLSLYYLAGFQQQSMYPLCMQA